MSSQGQITLCSSEPKRPKTHSDSIYNYLGDESKICPTTGRPYTVQWSTHSKLKKNGDVVMVDEFTCSECLAKIREAERNPHITYA